MTRPFEFRLAAVQRVRESARERRRVALAEAQRENDALDRLEARLAEARARCREELRRAAAPGPIDAARVAETRRPAAALRRDEADLRLRQDDLAATIERRRLDLLEADRDARAIEKLRERQLEQHRHEENRRELKSLDEAAARTIGHRSESSVPAPTPEYSPHPVVERA